jgi:hypothetical protein
LGSLDSFSLIVLPLLGNITKFYIYKLDIWLKVIAIVKNRPKILCYQTYVANGSSGFGAERRAWIERSTVRICRAGDHLSNNLFGLVSNQEYEGNL